MEQVLNDLYQYGILSLNPVYERFNEKERRCLIDMVGTGLEYLKYKNDYYLEAFNKKMIQVRSFITKYELPYEEQQKNINNIRKFKGDK